MMSVGEVASVGWDAAMSVHVTLQVVAWLSISQRVVQAVVVAGRGV